jgi:recombination protein RecA
MPSASILRAQIETALAKRIPSALSPVPRMIRPVASTGIETVDEFLAGGLPLGAITEMVGPECSGRTSFALSFASRMTQEGKVCAWIDVSNTLHPESAAATGVDLSRLLWVRCGVQARNELQPPTKGFALPGKYLIPLPAKKGLHGGGFGPHPRHEIKGLSEAVSGFLRSEVAAPQGAEPQRRVKEDREVFASNPSQPPIRNRRPVVPCKPWSRIEQALRVTDLLLQGGGFGAIVLDMGSVAPEYALRVPSAMWFRYRAAAERSQAAILLLTQHSCAKSSAGLVLRLQSGNELRDEATVFTGIEYRVEAERERFQPVSSNVIPLRKPPQRMTAANWQSRTTWAGRR